MAGVRAASLVIDEQQVSRVEPCQSRDDVEHVGMVPG